MFLFKNICLNLLFSADLIKLSEHGIPLNVLFWEKITSEIYSFPKTSVGVMEVRFVVFPWNVLGRKYSGDLDKIQTQGVQCGLAFS